MLPPIRDEDASRTVFATSRAADFLEARTLQSQTGQPVGRFGDVVIKELIDNALDAAEATPCRPEITLTVDRLDTHTAVTVADNGPGIPPDVVARILDFNVLVSDKAAYRGPTRGMQGNAIKTLLGIPHALEVHRPVVIEAQGVAHHIQAGMDPGGNPRVPHKTTPSDRIIGTSVSIPLPADISISNSWLQKFAVSNPHATFVDLAQRTDHDEPVFYKPTVPAGWRKPLTSDKTSVHWYDVPAMTKLVFAHIDAGDDWPLGKFLHIFDGLTSTSKAKTISAAVPHIKRLSDFTTDPDAVAVLLAAMQAETKAPKAASLGRVGEDHMRTCIDDWYGIVDNRFWYRRKEVDVDGVPWAIEVAVTETDIEGAVTWAVNYSPTFSDPLAGTRLASAEISTTGAASFLGRCDAFPDYSNQGHRAAVVHVLTPVPQFLDKGKTQLVVPSAAADVFAEALASAGKVLRKDAKRRQRDTRAETKRRDEQHRRESKSVTIKDAVFSLIPKAAYIARGGEYGDPGTLPFSVRSLYYKLRPLLQEITDQVLRYPYFTQDLVPKYQRMCGTIPGLYYEPRGELHEPHPKEWMKLGGLEVESYKPMPWRYDKVLYIEKLNLWPPLETSKLAERYDMAVILGQGYAAEAARNLLANISEDTTIFVLHDADPAGYNIARTLGEATARMPNHNIDVIDLGLTVADAIELDLQTETFTRDRKLPAQLELTPEEENWFSGQESGWDSKGNPNEWTGTRVELNAFSSPDLVAYIEKGLARHGAIEKVVPPADVLAQTAEDTHKAYIKGQVEGLLERAIDELTEALLEETAEHVDYGLEPDTIRDVVNKQRTIPWTEAVTDSIARQVKDSGIDLGSRFVELISEIDFSQAA